MQGNVIIVNKKPQMKAMQYLAKIKPDKFRLKYFYLTDRWEIVLYEKLKKGKVFKWAIFWKVSFYFKSLTE